MMRGLWEGELTPTDELLEPLNRCLDCRACETACPSAVPYGELLEKTRGVLKDYQKPTFTRKLGMFFLKHVLGSDKRMLWLSRMGKLLAVTRLHRLAGVWPFNQWLPAFMVRGSTLMPKFAGKSFKHTVRSRSKQGTKVGLFTGCIMDVADLEIHEATVKLLEAAGFEVVVPKAQTCCGALAVHAGERDVPRKMAAANAVAFPDDLQAVVVNAAGCGAQLKEYGHLFSDEGGDHAPWDTFGARVEDVLSFLRRNGQNLSIDRFKDDPVDVFYDAPCHLKHAQKDETPARALLKSLPGVHLIPLRDADACCGAAGVYNMAQVALADQILDRKLDDIDQCLGKHPKTAYLLTANPGCLYQLRMGCARRGLPLEVMHPAVFLADRLLPQAKR